MRKKHFRLFSIIYSRLGKGAFLALLMVTLFVIGIDLGFFLANPIFISIRTTISGLVITLSLLLSLQSIFTLIWMLYAWEDPDNSRANKSPVSYRNDQLSFSILIPARHEENVIRDTITAVSNMHYAPRLMEILVLCREDDLKTIAKVKDAINDLSLERVRLITFNDYPINKPHALNLGLKAARGDIITIFDAEDEPHPDLLRVINTSMLDSKADVIQSGVQLMNYRSNWFSGLNVLEYFFWFKSGLSFFSQVCQVSPLGGNTVFFKRQLLEQIGGWDEQCLTEDADIGIRLTAAGAKIKVIYDEQHVTREETPGNIKSFIKQRTRWDQGFLQIFLKGDVWKLPRLRQKIVAMYLLLAPALQAMLLIYTPIAVFLAYKHQVSLRVTLLSFIPFYLLLLQILVELIGLYEFTKTYNLKFSLGMLLKLVITFFPYQVILAFSSCRAIYRILRNLNSWEKTHHTNLHRRFTVSPRLMTEYAQ